MSIGHTESSLNATRKILALRELFPHVKIRRVLIGGTYHSVCESSEYGPYVSPAPIPMWCIEGHDYLQNPIGPDFIFENGRLIPRG